VKDYRFPFDEEVLFWLNGLAWDWLDALFVAASSRLFGVGVAVLFGLWVLWTHKRRAIRGVLQGTAASVLADNFGHLVLKPFFARTRPHLVVPDNLIRHWAEASATGPSLPSLHAATSFAFAVGLGLCLPRTLRITLPLAVLISVSRVAVGVHWPSDVLLGAIYGTLLAVGIHKLVQRWLPKPIAPVPPVPPNPPDPLES
jgi:undecaprenyl-diphosphatase